MDLDLLRRKSTAGCWIVFYFYIACFLPSAVEGSFWLTSLVWLVQVKMKIMGFLLSLGGTKIITHVLRLEWSADKGQSVCQYIFFSISFSNYVNG